MNAISAKNEKEKIAKVFCVSKFTLNKDRKVTQNDFERAKIVEDYIENI